MQAVHTLPGLFRHVVQTYQHALAFNERKDQRWVHTSTDAFALRVHRLALGLRALGLKRGQAVGILAEPSPWWLMVDCAIMLAGGVSVPLFTNSSEANLKYKIKDADLRLVFVSDQASARRFRQCRRLFAKSILQGDGPKRGAMIGENALMQRGDLLSTKQPTLIHGLCDQAQPDDVATIIYTSGTSGQPKGVTLTHRNLISQIHGAAAWFQLDCTNDRALSLLPLAHVFERVVVYFAVSQGVGIWFADNPKNLPELIVDVKPTCMTVVPRVLEKVYASIVSRVELSGVLSKPLGQWALKLAHSSDPESSTQSWRYRLAQQLVYPKIRQALGGRLQTVICGGAALSPRLARFYINIGVPVYQGYGLTEASPVITANAPGHNRIGTVGRPFPGVRVRISAEGEVLATGPNVMAGYHNDPLATQQAIDADGWLHTGDKGRLDDDGYLTITGRIKEMYKTAGGKYVCPAPIEQALTVSPFVDQACVVAQDRSYPSCLIFPDITHIRRVLGTNGNSALRDDELMNLPELREKIRLTVEQINDQLEPWERIKEYRLVADPLTVSTGGLTPTLKLRRQFLSDHYRDLIESMYTNGHHEMSTP